MLILGICYFIGISYVRSTLKNHAKSVLGGAIFLEGGVRGVDFILKAL